MLVKNILPTVATFTGDFIHPVLGKTATQSIEQWRLNYLEEIKLNNSKSDIGKFNTYVTCLLMQVVIGNIGGELYELLEKRIRSFTDINEENIAGILKEIGFFLQKRGVEVILGFKDLFLKKYKGQWTGYLNEAKINYKNNFTEDDVLKIKGVGLKTRDLALSSFLKEYSANDIHVVRVIVRTGLFVCGYGDVNIGTNSSKKEDYLFIRKLIIKLSNESFFSPGELDRIFWHFGRTICKKNPVCQSCPTKGICLTYQNKN